MHLNQKVKISNGDRLYRFLVSITAIPLVLWLGFQPKELENQVAYLFFIELPALFYSIRALYQSIYGEINLHQDDNYYWKGCSVLNGIFHYVVFLLIASCLVALLIGMTKLFIVLEN